MRSLLRLTAVVFIAMIALYLFFPDVYHALDTWVEDTFGVMFGGSEVVIDRDGVDVEVGGALTVGGLR